MKAIVPYLHSCNFTLTALCPGIFGMSRKQDGKLPKQANNYKEKEKENAIIRANSVGILR